MASMRPHPERSQSSYTAPLLGGEAGTDIELEERHTQADNFDSANKTHKDQYTQLAPLPSPLPEQHASSKYSEWLPTSLSHAYLFCLAILSAAFAIVCFALVATSRTNNGIANASSSGESRFMRRFLPTIVAVIYSLLWTPVAADVVRTEPWALLSQPGGARAKDSLLRGDRIWWRHLKDAMSSKSRSGGKRWAVLIAIIANLTTSIIINPLSAGLFDTITFVSTTEQQFSTIPFSVTGTAAPRIGDDTYLRAAINLIFNVSTSAWNTDEYSVIPFWPSEVNNAPLSAKLTDTSQVWEADQEVIVAETKCQPFTSVTNSTEPYGNTVWTNQAYLETDDGCAVILQGTNCTYGIWGQISNTTSQKTFSECLEQGNREFFAFCSKNATSTGFLHGVGDNARYFSGQVCTSSYLRATLPIIISNSVSRSGVDLNVSLLKGTSSQITESDFDYAAFETDFITQTGSTNLRPTVGESFGGGQDPNKNLLGPSLVLASSSDYNIDRLMQMDPGVVAARAQVIKQRFLGEVLLASYRDAEGQDRSVIQGKVTKTRSRLIVDLGVGIAMGVVFILLAGASGSLALLVALHKRPLHLLSDPNRSSTAATILQDLETSSAFKGLDKSNAKELTSTLGDETFIMENQRLILFHQQPVEQTAVRKFSRKSATSEMRTERITASDKEDDWRPHSLRRKMGTLLVVFLVAITAALAALYAVSLNRPLYQSAFVYSSEVKLGKLNVTTLAPYSIIPTLLAVGIKLWWSTIDCAYRRLAPFLAMATSPNTKASESASKSYISTPILWITILAVRRQYWLFALVTLGAVVSEVLQISMAALWSRELRPISFDADITTQYALRSIPLVFPDSMPLIRTSRNVIYPEIAKELYGGQLYEKSWVYGSLAQLAFGAQPPAWSKDGWSIPPINIDNIADDLTGLPSQQGKSNAFNVSLISSAVRGRVDCTPITDVSSWILEVNNFTSLTPWNSSTNTRNSNLKSGFEFSPEIRTVNYKVANGTLPSVVAIGQWLHFNYSADALRGDPLYNPNSPQNFTVLWAHSSYPYYYEREVDKVIDDLPIPPRLIFAEKPQITALNCQPIFETVKMQATINSQLKSIEHFELLEEPQIIPDVWSDKFNRHFANETAYRQGGTSTTNEIQYFNTTASWGYVFQLALLQACNVQGLVAGAVGEPLATGFPGATPFSFIETDLYSDPYSYAALALVGQDRTRLLDPSTLMNVTQTVFSTFFQWFASTESGYTDDYWAYEPVGAQLPQDLDFGPTESTVTVTSTITHKETLCVSSPSTYSTLYDTDDMRTFTVTLCGKPTSTSITENVVTQTYTTIENTRSSSRSSISRTASRMSSEPSARTIARSTTDQLALRPRVTGPRKRDEENKTQAQVSFQTEVLEISSIAMFLSISILAILIIITMIVFLIQNRQLCLLPRDFDSPASLLAAVYASDRLKSWAERQQHIESTATDKSQRQRGDYIYEDVCVGMGHFKGCDGQEHWGIEVTEDSSNALHRPV